MAMSDFRYIAEHYTSTGNIYYYKQTYIRSDGEPYWSKPRPVTVDTYNRAKGAGYSCEWVVINRPVADVISFDELVRYKRLREEWRNRDATW